MSSFYYIANGKMHLYDGKENKELHSGVLDSYIRRVKDAAERTEWKYNGTGAEFTGTYRPGASAEDRVSAISSSVRCLGTHNGDVVYSLDIDSTNGIYRKSPDSESEEGIVLCSGSNAYRDFDILGDMMVASSAFAGESHIGVMELGKNNFTTHTEGHTVDHSPVWSRSSRGVVYFCSSGLPEGEASEGGDMHDDGKPIGMSRIVSEMYSSARSARRGPTSIARLNVLRGELSEILSDEEYDYTHPQSLADGSLYYIRKPYREGGKSDAGCLLDILLLPFRLIEALFGFLNVFSAKYSGKTLSSRDVKSRDEKEVFIDGNLINAERELKANARKGDKNPGIAPRDWELRCLSPNGEDKLIKKGALSYRVLSDGKILFSNGSAILLLDSEGGEEKLVSARGVTFIKEC